MITKKHILEIEIHSKDSIYIIQNIVVITPLKKLLIIDKIKIIDVGNKILKQFIFIYAWQN